MQTIYFDDLTSANIFFKFLIPSLQKNNGPSLNEWLPRIDVKGSALDVCTIVFIPDFFYFPADKMLGVVDETITFDIWQANPGVHISLKLLLRRKINHSTNCYLLRVYIAASYFPSTGYNLINAIVNCIVSKLT